MKVKTAISWKEFEDKIEAKKVFNGTTRKCWRCHVEKPLLETNFHPAPGGPTAINPTGLMNQCRACYDQKELAF
jgi:hypothetical protein